MFNNHIKQSIKKIPTPMAGLALGIASLGICLESLYNADGLLQISGAMIAGLLLVLITVKFLVFPKLLKADLAHPVVGSVLPTFAMATMVISKTISKLEPNLAIVFWLTAIVIHIIFFVIFTRNRILSFELQDIVPSWFVPPVGIIVSVVTFPGVTYLLPLAHGLLLFGLISYALLLPIVLYRLIFAENVPDSAKPTLAILAAPASLSLAGYLTIVANPSVLVIAVLAGIAVLMTALIYLSFIHLFRLPFSPGYAAFTFPLVISSTAMFKTAHWMQSTIRLSSSARSVHTLAIVEAIVATLVVVYVTGHYVFALFKHTTRCKF